jgi:predicted deacetylase
MRINRIGDRVDLTMLYDDASLISAALGVPNHAFAAPDFEVNVGASQSTVDEIGIRLWSTIQERADYSAYRQLALKTANREETRRFNIEVSLSKDDVVLLARAFREAVRFTKAEDDFYTMTGHTVEDAASLQKELDDMAERVQSGDAN